MEQDAVSEYCKTGIEVALGCLGNSSKFQWGQTWELLQVGLPGGSSVKCMLDGLDVVGSVTNPLYVSGLLGTQGPG